MDEVAARDAWDKVNALIAQIAVAQQPYELGLAAMSDLVLMMPESETAAGLYLVWALSTDRLELDPPEMDDENGALMRRAASEWLAAKDDEAARKKYLNRWVYEIFGYGQPPEAGQTWRSRIDEVG